MTTDLFQRRQISSSKRFRILERDRFTCRYCGRSAPSVPLVVDHVEPVSRGGGNGDSNLVTACQSCNASKSARVVQAPGPAVAQTAAAPSKPRFPVGWYFHTFEDGRWGRSGVVKAEVSPGVFRVAFYETVMLVMGGVANEGENKLVPLSEMGSWEFEWCADNFWLAAKNLQHG